MPDGASPKKTKMTAIRLPVSVIDKIDRLFGKGNRSRFIYEAIEKELKRRKRLLFIEEDANLISDDMKDSIEYVNEMRKFDVERFELLYLIFSYVFILLMKNLALQEGFSKNFSKKEFLCLFQMY